MPQKMQYVQCMLDPQSQRKNGINTGFITVKQLFGMAKVSNSVCSETDSETRPKPPVDEGSTKIDQPGLLYDTCEH